MSPPQRRSPGILHRNVASHAEDNARGDSDDVIAAVEIDMDSSQGDVYENTDADSSSSLEGLSGDTTDPHGHLLGQSGFNGRIRRGHSPAVLQLSSSRDRQPPFAEVDETSAANVVGPIGNNQDDEKPVSWRSLPNKSQLAILTIARLSEPLTQTSLQAYLFYQLKSFDPQLPDSTISTRAGLLQGCFTAAQFVTAMIWGRLADTHFMGRKRVLVIGLFGTSITCVGFGFSQSFVAAAIFRTMGGALNSNIGVMRTMIAELIVEKKCVCPFLNYDKAPNGKMTVVPSPRETLANRVLDINLEPSCSSQCVLISAL
ncbi:hypothetical protein ACJ73_04450 [Blastomyces percursus]|uniref:Major facilitator superfamily (MFS) profile domain-containing protein n=1 Tax=Blastomyces percursus TaxID=1658174 RepID=A0A1J9Q6M0_9EURO|nr:hypothetical protein ACJ73_04450 [Blastomyces percursus]